MRKKNSESKAFLSEQIITYIGNKRALLGFIGEAVLRVCAELGRQKLNICDLFAGSGIVSRYMKQFSSSLYSNDLEDYCKTINSCYLSNKSTLDLAEITRHYDIIRASVEKNGLHGGFISELYAPENDLDIRPGERVFYTARNARYIDTVRQLIAEAPAELQKYYLAPLLYEASVHNNTSGVFKGFYKNSQTGVGQFGGNGRNALSRITGDIDLPFPIFGNFECEYTVLQRDANELSRDLPKLDLVYLDPPYNQHPYGSNYFMLNLINGYAPPRDISRVSGIPDGWNKSVYNRKSEAYDALRSLCASLNARYLLISFNSDGFIKKEQMLELLSSVGTVSVMETSYNTFRGSRNLRGRDITVKEYLYLIKKG